MSVGFTPVGARVLVRRIEADDVTPGGIILPEVAKKKADRGEVLAVGPGRTTEFGSVVYPSVQVGAVIFYTQYGGSEVTVNGEKLLILGEHEILGAFTGEEK